MKVCVVDERSEIAACVNGKPQNDLGKRTDVLDACPKVLGMRMVLRSMSPDVIAVDELGKEEEFTLLDSRWMNSLWISRIQTPRSIYPIQEGQTKEFFPI